MKNVLRLTRAHTAPLEMIPAVAGSALVLGEINHPLVWMWAVFGLLYHLAGYGQNSYADWENGYDKDDPYKQHHPLNNDSDMGPLRAAVIVQALVFAAAGYVAIASFLSSFFHGSLITAGLSLVLIAIAYSAGEMYNKSGKETPFKFMYISLAHSFVFLIPYVSLGGSDPIVMLGGWLYVFLWVVFQIAISGEVMGITMMGEENFLRSIGARVVVGREIEHRDVIDIPVEAMVIAHGIKLVGSGLAIYIAHYLGASDGLIMMMVGIALAMIIPVFSILEPGNYKRDERVRNVSIIEMLTLFLLCLMAAPVIGFGQSSLLMAASAVWVVSLNYVEWGTYISPKV